jgi:hypothetical protein
MASSVCPSARSAAMRLWKAMRARFSLSKIRVVSGSSPPPSSKCRTCQLPMTVLPSPIRLSRWHVRQRARHPASRA